MEKYLKRILQIGFCLQLVTTTAKTEELPITQVWVGESEIKCTFARSSRSDFHTKQDDAFYFTHAPGRYVHLNSVSMVGFSDHSCKLDEIINDVQFQFEINEAGDIYAKNCQLPMIWNRSPKQSWSGKITYDILDFNDNLIPYDQCKGQKFVVGKEYSDGRIHIRYGGGGYSFLFELKFSHKGALESYSYLSVFDQVGEYHAVMPFQEDKPH